MFDIKTSAILCKRGHLEKKSMKLNNRAGSTGRQMMPVRREMKANKSGLT